MESLEAVELAMALEECCGAGGFEIDPETTLGDLHWRMIQQECQRRPPRRSADAIWADLARLLEEQGVPAAQIKQQTRIVDLIL
jgi:hypothetical protein